MVGVTVLTGKAGAGEELIALILVLAIAPFMPFSIVGKPSQPAAKFNLAAAVPQVLIFSVLTPFSPRIATILILTLSSVSFTLIGSAILTSSFYRLKRNRASTVQSRTGTN